MLDDVHHGLKMGQHSTPHEDGNLLHDLDARVACLHGVHEVVTLLMSIEVRVCMGHEGLGIEFGV